MIGWAFLDVSAVAFAQDVYTATVVAPRGLRTARTAKLTLTFTQYATEEDAAKLDKIYDEQGSEGVFKAFRTMNMGTASILDGPTARINWVRVWPGNITTRVIIITDPPLHFPRIPGEDPPPKSPVDVLGLIQLEVGDGDGGKGSAAEVLKIDVTDEGVLQVQASARAAIKLENVKQEK
jgi:hypothetical protein